MKLEKDTAKKEAKAEAKADAALKKKLVRLNMCGIDSSAEGPLYRHHKYSSLKLRNVESRLTSIQVTIKRIERNKRKHVTAIHGLEAFGMKCLYLYALHLGSLRMYRCRLEEGGEIFCAKVRDGRVSHEEPARPRRDRRPGRR